MKKLILLIISHGAVAVLGFAIGIYVFPILIAPEPPNDSDIRAIAGQSQFTGLFTRDLDGSDFLHWGEGTVSISRDAIVLNGRVAPGPNYKLYLSPEFVENEVQFEQARPRMVRVGDVNTFDNFIVPIPDGIDPSQYSSVIVWCESFDEFISAAKYQ